MNVIFDVRQVVWRYEIFHLLLYMLSEIIGSAAALLSTKALLAFNVAANPFNLFYPKRPVT